MKPLIYLGAGLGLGIAATYLSLATGTGGATRDTGDGGGSAREPLYWVAPMDASYRRDGPGKSPMGMDLVPVYAEEGSDEGLVRIPPTVVNNLGVRTAEVREHELGERVRGAGFVRYDEASLVHEHPRVSGWIERLYVQSEGEQVEAGAPLYTLYAPELVSAQEELALAVARDRPDLIAATEARLRALHLPEDLIDRLRRGGAVEQTVTFRAESGGVVDILNIREGFFVEPGTTLMQIGALDTVWVDVEVFPRFAAQLREGLPVRMTTRSLPGRSWQGQVDLIYPTIDPSLRTLKLRLRFENPDRELRPNLFTEVEIATPPVRMLAVPRQAVIRVAGQARVVREEAPGAYRSVPVHLGRSIGAWREVLHGLSAGDRVVTSAQFLLDSESNRSAEFARMDGADSGAAAPAPHDRNGHDMNHNMGSHDMSDHSMPAGATAGETSTLSDPAMHDPEDHDAATHDMAGHDVHGKAPMDRPHDHGAEYDGDSAAAQEPDEKSGTAGTEQDGHRHD
jgi:Cu(I)/Ag(I) efflux system membrane fusion protein